MTTLASRNLHDKRMKKVFDLIAERSAERARLTHPLDLEAHDRETYEMRHNVERTFYQN